MRQTIQAYFDQLNKAGGVNGRKLDLVALTTVMKRSAPLPIPRT
jgi:ABC-type branched-subunit amino acid transport system substrate-binding protein